MKIKLSKDTIPEITLLPNQFIDEYMIQADGEFVKIYLMLLRLTSAGKYEGIEQLADLLSLTSKDVSRALKYWEKQGLLQVEEEKEVSQTPSQVVPPVLPQVVIPEKQEIRPSLLKKQMNQADLRHITYMAEMYLGHPLSTTELNSFCYIDTALGFSTDLLEYLIEYCVSKNKKSVRYMETVAISWYQQGIDTVEKAKSQTVSYQNNTFAIMKAFGMGDRNPGRAELDMIKKWNEMGWDFPIIAEAIKRTLLKTHQASFPYANSILESWKKANVHNLEEIALLDSKFHANANKQAKENATAVRAKQDKQPANAFHNFEQREYDYDALESKLLHQP